MRKTLAIALAAAGSITAPYAIADSFHDNARVISARPVVERIPVSREECWSDRVRGYEERSVTRTDTGAPIGAGTVLGAVVGGVIGHQVGSGHGNTAATVGGAIMGGIVGNQIERDQNAPRQSTEVERVPVERNVQRCRTVDEVREATVGFDVRYEYHGRQLATRLPHDPGRMLRIRVDVQPIEGRPDVPPGPRPPAYSR